MVVSKQLLRITALVVVVLSLSLSHLAQGESSNISELRAKIDEYLQSETHSDEAIITALQLQELAHSESDLASEVFAFKSLGEAYTQLGAYEKAMLAYESAVGIYDNSLGLEIQRQLYVAMSNLLFAMESYEEALGLMEAAAAIAEDAGDELMLAILEVNKATILSTTDKTFAAE